MTITSLTYTPPIRRSATATTLDFDLLEAAIAHFEAGEFLDAATDVFKHIVPGTPVDLAHAPVSFTQGSSRVTATLADGWLEITVPLVRLPAGGAAVAALRYALTSINGSGQLAQARLRGDDLFLEFRERLDALHPHKLVEVLRRTPMSADRHDDWMVGQFAAIALDRGSIQPVTDDEAAIAAEVWKQHWADVEELYKEAQRKRSVWFLNEVTAFTLNRLRFTMPLGGSLLPRLMEAGGTFNDSDIDPMKREAALAKCIKEMKAISADELRKNLGHAEYAINPLAEGDGDKITSFFVDGTYMETIDKYRTTGHPLEALLALVGTYYYLLAMHTWDPEIEAELKRGLAASSGKPLREAANLMFEHATELAEACGGDDDGEDGDDDDDDDDSDEEEAGNE
jgi:hypothetical protein